MLSFSDDTKIYDEISQKDSYRWALVIPSLWFLDIITFHQNSLFPCYSFFYVIKI